MVDLNTFTVEELKALKADVTEEIKTRNAEAKEAERKAKADREAQFTGNVNTGDVIRFFYNREEMEGTVERANPKTVTIVFEDEKRHYIKYENVLEVLEAAPVEEAEESEEVAV